jgi:hypothetical protein
MSHFARLSTSLVFVALLAACAHPISISPDLNTLPARQPSVDKSVAYVISAADRDLEITTGGGGGDSVRYFLHRELEAGIFKALSSIYKRVTLLRSATGKDTGASSSPSLVFVPKLASDSSSASILTWPPTNFLITIEYDVFDTAGKRIYNNRVLGRGEATFEEFSKDFGLSGKRAAEDVLKKFADQVYGATELK